MGNIMNSKMDDYVIGIVGGMGSYATVDFFARVVDAFPVEKEWERPRIIIDNNCTMPSRVRAILYDENTNILIDELSSSVRNLIMMGATKVVLACNTSHCFLDDVYNNVPEAEGKIINIITSCAEEIKAAGEKEVFILATEGTILSKIYEDTFGEYGIDCKVPTEKDFTILRNFIEGVKQKKITPQLKDAFIDYINGASSAGVVLGCTELPILWGSCYDENYVVGKKIFDPLDAALKKIKGII